MDEMICQSSRGNKKECGEHSEERRGVTKREEI
jgi:hypothetical protein